MKKRLEILFYNFSGQKIPSKNFFSGLLESFLLKLKETKPVEISLIFVKPQLIKKLNSFWRKKNKETTVLSFPSGFLSFFKKDFFKKRDLGEIVFCPQVIKKKAKKEKITQKELYKKLLAHSILHLYGYSHFKEKDLKEMLEKEENLLKE